MGRYTIGFFDSGVGGLTVLSSARRRLPSADYLFYADTDHVPYGTKTPAEVLAYSMEAVESLRSSGAEAVVVACNTATSMAIRELRRAFPIPIVGMEPAVKPAAATHPGERILVCATPLTIGGEKLHTLIESSFPDGAAPDLVALPELVRMAEEERFDPSEAAALLESRIDTHIPYAAVVLGCTHFLYFRPSFRRLFPVADLIDGNRGTVSRLLSLLGAEECPTGEPGTVRFIESGRPVEDPERQARFLRLLQRTDADGST